MLAARVVIAVVEVTTGVDVVNEAILLVIVVGVVIVVDVVVGCIVVVLVPEAVVELTRWVSVDKLTLLEG